MASAPATQTSPEKDAAPPWEAKRTKARKGRLRRFLMWTLLIGLVAFVGYGLRPRPTEVEVGSIVRGPLTVYVSEEGKTRVRNRYIVSAPVAGQMRRVTLKAGAEVKAGETLIAAIEPTVSPLLDPRAKAQAEARLEAMKASQKRADESLAMARTAAQFAAANWDRVKIIQKSGSVSKVDLDNAERDASIRQQETRAAEFAVQVAKFELEQAEAALLQITTPGVGGVTMDIKSPVSGRVLKVMQESASVVSPGTQVMEIGDPADIEIEAEILSKDAVAIKPGAEVTIEQWGGDPIKGRVRLVEPAAFTKVSALGVEEQRVYVLSDLVSPPPEAMRLGDRYRVEVKVAVWHRDDALLIPAGAIFHEGSDWKTFLFSEGKAKAVKLEAGRSDGRMTELLDGAAEGTEVILHPPDSVKHGVSVKRRDG